MKRKELSKQAEEIQRRFFEALDLLIAQGRLKGIKTFCDEHGLNRTKYSNRRNALASGSSASPYKLIDIEALTYLVKDYGISAEWLLMGKGEVIKR